MIWAGLVLVLVGTIGVPMCSAAEDNDAERWAWRLIGTGGALIIIGLL